MNMRTARSAFYGVERKIVSDRQLQNEMANLEQQVLRAKLVIL